MIKIDKLSKKYDKDYVLENLSCNIKDNSIYGLVGANGSGKSTMAKLIIGLLEAKKGKIQILGQELNEESVYELRSHVGIVFQNPDNQFIGSTVADDIAFGLENHQIPRKEMIEQIDKYAKLVDMQEYLEYNPENLSGGQKQRVAIAGALAMETELIIFDESTSMLDPKGTKEINLGRFFYKSAKKIRTSGGGLC